MTIIPDLETAIVMAIPFLITYAALHFILLKPLYEYMQERHEAVGVAVEEAGELEDQAEGRVSALEAKLNGARDEVAALRASARQSAHAQESAILTAAREEADAKVAEALASIKADEERAAQALRETASALSQQMASQVLGREVGA